MIPLIKKLAEAYGPSGRESGLRRIVRGEIEGRCDSVTEDRMGNLIGVIKPKSGTGFRIMLAAHLDEIGLIVSHVDERGFARFSPIGKVYPVYCAGGRVRFESGATGVIGLERREDETRIPALEHFYLDLGVRAGADCPVRMGDTAVFDRPLVESGGRLIAKAMDDRVGVAILVETMRRLERTPHEIQFVFTVQEELGARGARTSAYGLDPEIGIAVDVTPSARVQP
jgi:putative aminopeptidase FrvX